MNIPLQGIFCLNYKRLGVFSNVGDKVSSPCPSYANILGLISSCADKTVSPKDNRIGFEFRHVSEDIEIEPRVMHGDCYDLHFNCRGFWILLAFTISTLTVLSKR
jgi:hypothetical protein